MKRRLAAAVALLVPLSTSAAEYEYLPPQPQAGEQFVITGALSYGSEDACSLFTMSYAGVSADRIDVREYTGPGYKGDQFSCRFGALVPGLPEGRYYADIRRANGPLGSPGVVTVVAGSASQPARRDLTGNWMVSAEPGWGLNIVQGDSGKLFIAWMMYRPFASHWVIVPDGRWITPTTWRGVAYQTRNVRFDAAADTARLQTTPVGYVEVAFTGQHEATFTGRIIDEVNREPMVGKQAALRRFEF